MFEFTLWKFQQSLFHPLNESDAKLTKTNHALSDYGNFSFFLIGQSQIFF